MSHETADPSVGPAKS